MIANLSVLFSVDIGWNVIGIEDRNTSAAGYGGSIDALFVIDRRHDVATAFCRCDQYMWRDLVRGGWCQKLKEFGQLKS